MKLQAVQDNNVQLVTEILESLNLLPEKDASADELARILQEPHFKVLKFLSPLGELIWSDLKWRVI